MDFISESQYCLTKHSIRTKDLTLCLIDTSLDFIVLNEHLITTLELKDEKPGNQHCLTLRQLIRVFLTNNYNLISYVFETITEKKTFGNYCSTFKYIIRFCDFETIKLLGETYGFMSKYNNYDRNNTQLFYLVAERHDDNIELINYLLESSPINNLPSLTQLNYFHTAAVHDNINMCKIIYSRLLKKMDSSELGKFLKKHCLEFPTDILDFLVKKKLLTMEIIYCAINKLQNPILVEYMERIEYIVELINEGKIILAKDEIGTIRRSMTMFTELQSITDKLI
jgi:hypothetical protein